MIASVKECLAVVAALLCLLPADAIAADDLVGAARELARRTAAYTGRGETISISWRNLSSLPSSDVALAQTSFQSGLRDSGVKVAENGATFEAHLTLSENQSQYLMVAELRKGDERQTFLVSWKLSAPAGAGIGSGGTASLERKLLWEQADPILDIALTPTAMLVLSPGKLTLYARRDSGFEERQSVPINLQRAWPRDPRARLRLAGNGFRAFLPGAVCTGSIEPMLTADCKPSEEPWTLDSGSRTVLLAAYAAGRNYFDGRIVTQNGIRKVLPPFYSAGSASGLWAMALLDGRTQIYDGNFDAVGNIGGWGSDLAGTDAHCGTGSQILATKAGDAGDADSVTAYSLVNRSAIALTPPADFAGPVTALWTWNGDSVVAVVRDAGSGRYAAYLLTVVCGG